MTFDSEFKKALQLLPEKEKDKLILRLLKGNLPLANRLRFELIDTESAQEKREKVRTVVLKRVQTASNRYYSPGYLLMEAREISGVINEHVSITKDKAGEIFLNCLLIRRLLELNNQRIAIESRGNAHTFCIYVVARMFKIMLLIQKQHEDLHLEFRDDLEAIGLLISKNPVLLREATSNGLDINWLTRFEIPEDLASLHRKLRDNGFLK